MNTNEIASPSNDGGININQYVRVLRRRKWSIAFISLLFVCLGILNIMNATPIYMASAKIQADPVQPNATAQDQFMMNSMVFLFYETQYEIIQSRKVAETVVDKLDLVDLYKKDVKDNPEKYQKSGLSALLSEAISIVAEDEEKVDRQLEDSAIRTMLAQSIQGNLSVEGGTQSQIININFQSEDPVLAAKIANAISESYIQFGLEARLSQIKDTSEWLADQLGDLKLTLQQSEDKLRNFRLSQNLMDTEQQERITNTQLQTLNTELVRAQTQLSEARELHEQVSQITSVSGDYRTLGPVLQNNTIRDLVREESTLNRKVLELSERYGEKHPKMIAARSDWASAQANLNREVLKIVENIKKDYRSAQVKEQNVRSLIEKTRNELQSYQGDSFELTRLEREVENNRRIYESFLGKLMEADVSGEYDASNIRVIDSATVPSYPIKPRPMFTIAFSLIIGVFFGGAYAFTREFMGTVFRTPDQMESEIGLPSLGVTPLVKKSRNVVKPERQYLSDSRSTFSEAINTIRTGLLFSNIDNPPKSFLVTSTVGSEGKTTLSVNLAVALSQLGPTVLIDMDLRKPAIAKNMGLNNKIGLSTAITNGFDGEIFQKVEGAPDLSIVTSGETPKNPMELISSTSFKEILDQLSKRFEYIVIDSPPTLPVSDACILAKMVDATILAVKAEDTKIASVKETVGRLRKVNASITGLVLTQASPQKMSYYGEHYYQDEYYGT